MATRSGSSLLASLLVIGGLAAVGVGGYRLVSGQCPLSGCQLGCSDSAIVQTAAATTTTTQHSCCQGGAEQGDGVMTVAAPVEGGANGECSEAAHCASECSEASEECKEKCPMAGECPMKGETEQAAGEKTEEAKDAEKGAG